MLAIRLQRIGKKNRPSYRVVVSEKSRDMHGKHLEILGNYDPVAQPKVINLKAERIKHWLSVGAQASGTVYNILVSQKIVEGKKVQSWKPKKKPAGSGGEAQPTLAPAKDATPIAKETPVVTEKKPAEAAPTAEAPIETPKEANTPEATA